MNSFIKSNGFSLIEVMVALIILSVSLLALAGLMVTTTKNNSYGSHITEATTFAQDKLEELRVTQWSNINNGADARLGSTGINYSRNWIIATNGTANLRAVTITVRWNDGINHSISLFSTMLNRL